MASLTETSSLVPTSANDFLPFVAFNAEVMPLESLPLSPINRSFLYGDSLFETIIIKNNKPKNLDLHIARLKKGCKALSLKWPKTNTLEHITDICNQLSVQNNLQGEGRIRWHVWRADGGKFIPTSNTLNQLITLESIPAFVVKHKHALVSDEVRVGYSPISAFKTGNSLPYILAGLEAKKNDVDDIILLGGRHEIAETISSNIFWIADNKVYTPSLNSGCVEGIMRKLLVKWFEKQEIIVEKVRAAPAVLYNADCVFTSNVAGIHYISKLHGHELCREHPLVEAAIKELILK